MFTFAHIWVFVLAPLPLVVYWWVPAKSSRRPSVRVPFLSRLLASSESPVSLNQGNAKSFGILVIVWLLVLIAMARPQWLEPPMERIIPTRDLLLIVDLSGSMDHEDFTNEAGKTVNRLTAVKEVVGDFLTQREGDRVGLVVFGNSPFLQVPFTTDLDLCRQLLNETDVGMAGPRTAFGDAIGLGIQLFENSDVPTKTIVALTDGNDTASSVPPEEASRVARDRGITVYTIAVGDPTTVGEEQIDQEALKDVAETTNGEFYLALNRDQLVDIYDRIDQVETRDVKTVSHRPRHDLFYWPLGIALVISLLSHAVPLARARHARLTASTTRLRVNSRTFELETVEL
ncbi:Ca-activated chloride channel family protein [Rhodopirellula rubra]|uniref:Ca-activated chloride channel family protein n=1 Tax=Aporhodopirellula rubra TaxID=980271 RepID=A0A7W5DXG4_9BACT|nr:VWA domain-containing protein [Aporhodopirellula rubra]MBB3205843.1 Ca-activated chloride channel family protein [Aporhodopirellula rubra]